MNYIFFIILTFISLPALAAEDAIDIKDVFCDALRVEKNYDDGNYKAYKMMVPGNDGWVFRSFSDFKVEYPMKPSAKAQLKIMQDAFKSQGIDFVTLYPPTRGMLHSDHLPKEEAERFGYSGSALARKNYKEFLEDLNNSGIEIVGLPDTPSGEPFFYMRDHHWDHNGAKKAAIAIASYVKNLPSYVDLTKTNFVTKSMGPFNFNGTADKVFKGLCNTVLPTEISEKFITERVADATGEADLFGETPEPEVVLMGTSNSTLTPSVANFEGFLKESLSTDVLNMSVSGGSIDTSLISYLNTPHYKDKKGKVLIWEVPGYYDMTKWEGRIFRQAIPAIYGTCDGNAVVETKDLALKEGAFILFNDLDEKKIHGQKYYLSMTYSEPVRSKYKINFKYGNGKRNILKISRSKRYPHDNQYFALLKDNANGSLSKIVLDIPAKMADLTVSAAICKIPNS